MRKISLLLLLAFLAFILCGCRTSYSPKIEDFEFHLSSLAEDPEDCVDVGLIYSRYDCLEDAFTTLYCYTSGDEYVSSNQAEDAWIYIKHYIDALHSEIDVLYNEYHAAY